MPVPQALPLGDPYPDAESVCHEIEQWVGPRRLYPISLSVPESLILDQPPEKLQDSGTGISKGRRQYRFGPGQQQAYYEDYQRSYFGLTYKKGGWDCLRHLEIMANGCLPFFLGIEDCPRYTMAHYPKTLMKQVLQDYAQAVTIDGFNLSFDPGLAGESLHNYEEQVRQSLDHTRQHLSTKAMASYVLDKAGHRDAKSVLYISSARKPDYICDLLFHGMRSLLGEGCVDVAKIWWMYNNADPQKVGKLYGRGFTYSQHLPDLSVDRGSIKKRIAKRDFDVIVFGSVNRCHDLLPYVRRFYEREQVILVDGEDYCRLVGWSKKHNPPIRRFDTARRLPREQIVKQGVCFKREIDLAVLMAYNTT